MRIVDRKTFLELPEGTLFHKYVPHCLEPLTIMQGKAGSNDFVVQDLEPDFDGANDMGGQADVYEGMLAGYPHPPINFEGTFRDGLFDEDQLFLVYEEADKQVLIARLLRTLLPGEMSEWSWRLEQAFSRAVVEHPRLTAPDGTAAVSIDDLGKMLAANRAMRGILFRLGQLMDGEFGEPMGEETQELVRLAQTIETSFP